VSRGIPSTAVLIPDNFKVFKLFSMDNKKCRPWDSLPSKAYAVDSTLKVPVKAQIARSSHMHPSSQFSPLGSLTTHFIFYFLINSA
jgi:hypothetical protein